MVKLYHVLFADLTLSSAVQMEQVLKVFAKIPDCVDCLLDAEVRSVGVSDWDLQDGFSAAV